MKNILVFGAGKSATVLIRYLLDQAAVTDWMITIADSDINTILAKTGAHSNAVPVVLNILDHEVRSKQVSQADVVISLLPPSLHIHVAKDCIAFRKPFLSASYIDPQLRALEPEINKSGVLFLCEMGLDPGIDHMSAMRLIDTIKADGGSITRFISHCGGLVAPISDTNPWHYKISWNPANIVAAGKAGAIYKEHNVIVQKTYAEIFGDCKEVTVPPSGKLAYYPNRDSTSYIHTYNLEEAADFLRTTLRHPHFCLGWKHIIATGLTSETALPSANPGSVKDWCTASVQSHTAFPDLDTYIKNAVPAHEQHIVSTLFSYLGLNDQMPLPLDPKTSAQVLQYLLEQKLKLLPHDRDMIVMLHEISYTLNNESKQVKSSLIVEGEDAFHTAMAKTVGLPLGIAAKMIATSKLSLTGLHIPILPEIYNPVLNELETYGISFVEL